MKRTKRVYVWLDEKEYKWLMDNVSRSCLRREPYLRELIANREILPGPTEEWKQLTRLLLGMSNNLNQLVFLANCRKTVSKKDIEEIKGMKDDLWKIIDRVKDHKSIEGID